MQRIIKTIIKFN